jgi:hypothetical protein
MGYRIYLRGTKASRWVDWATLRRCQAPGV